MEKVWIKKMYGKSWDFKKCMAKVGILKNVWQKFGSFCGSLFLNLSFVIFLHLCRSIFYTFAVPSFTLLP